MFAQHAIGPHSHDQPAFVGLDMDVADPLAYRFGDDRVDQADGRRIVGAVEQILGARQSAGDHVDIAAFERSRHRARRVDSIVIGQQAVEIGGVRGHDAQRRGQISLHLDQHRRIGILAQRREPGAVAGGRDDDAVRAGKAIGDIHRRRGRRVGRSAVGHGRSPCGVEGGISTASGVAGVTVTSAAVAALGAGGTVPR